MATNANASIKKNTIIKKVTVGRPVGVGQVSNGNLTGLDDVDGAMLFAKAGSDSIASGQAFAPGNYSYLIRWDSDRQKFGFYPAGQVLKDNLKHAITFDSADFQADSQTFPRPASIKLPIQALTPGTFGSGTQIPSLTVNSKGIVTGAGSVVASTVDSFGYEPSLGRLDLKLSTGAILSAFPTLDAYTTDSLAEGSTNLYFSNAKAIAAVKPAFSANDAGGDGSFSYDSVNAIFTYTGPSADETRKHFSASNSLLYDSTTGNFKNPQPLDSAANPVFNQVTLTGALRGPAELVIDPAAYNANTGSVKILGNLQVQGTTTQINSTTVNLQDKNIVLADSAVDSAASNDGGLTLGGSGASLIYSHSDAAWVFNRPLRRDINLLSFHSTSDVSEGTNLYYLSTRADSDAKNAISVTDNGGDGALNYNATTGVITYDGPTALEVRSHFSTTSPVTKDSNGVFGIDSSQLSLYFIDKDLAAGRNGKIIRNSSVNIKGNQFILDADSDTIMEVSSDDEVKFTIGGKESLKVKGGNQFSDFTNMELISDEASGIASPSFDLYRTSASPLPGDTLGRINFYGKDDSGNSQLYSSINGSIITTTNGSEEGSIELNVNKSGAFSGSTTFVVTVISSGGNKFVLDGVTNPVITLKRGVTYTFDQSAGTNGTHPLAFKDGSGNPYTTGVTVNGVAGNPGASVVFAVPLNAPDNLLYYCTTHGNAMGNSISVEDEGIHLNTVFHDNRIVFHRDQYLEWNNNKNSIHECILDWDSPTAARTIKLPDATGTILVGSLGNNPRSYFSAGGDLSYDSSLGRFSFDVETIYTKANFDSDFNDALDETTLNGTGLSFDSASNTLSITNTGVVAGHYGSGTKIPRIKINAQGQIDSASLIDVAGISSISFDSATGVFAINTADGGNFTTTLFDSDYTKKRSREAFSLIDAGGDGSMTYDSASGKFTYTGPSAAEVKAHFSGGNGITLTAGGRIDIDSSASPTVNSLVNTLGSISSTPTLVQATSGSGVIVDTTPHNSDFMSIEYTVHMSEDVIDASQVSKVLVTYNKSTVSFAEYGMVSSFANDSDIGTLSADVSGANIRLQFTRAAGMGTVNIKPVKQIIS